MNVDWTPGREVRWERRAVTCWGTCKPLAFSSQNKRDRYTVLLLVVPFWNRGEVKLDVEHEMKIVIDMQQFGRSKIC